MWQLSRHCLIEHSWQIFTRVLNARLMPFLESQEIVEEQGGFRGERGTIDVLHTFVEATNGRRRAGNKTYCAFIDVKKAYDRVWRDGLWKRLSDSGVQGKVWRLLRAGYVTIKSYVLCDGEQSQWFDSAVGVRQGCVLYPVLYSYL